MKSGAQKRKEKAQQQFQRSAAKSREPTEYFAGMGQFGVAVSAMKCEMCFSFECHQSAKVRTAVAWEACKRKSQSSTCPRYFQLCCIYCDS